MSGLVFAGGICAALLQRERTGEAVVVDSSLMGTAMWFNGPAIISSTFPPEQQMFNARPPREALSWSGNTYRTSDDRFLYLSFLGDPQKHWVDLCGLIGRPELATDPRFASAADRAANNTDLIHLLDDVFGGRPLAEWRTTLAPALGVWAPVQTAREMHEDPQAIANRYVQDVKAGSRTLPLVSPPISFDQNVGDIRRAPEYGEHTDEVLAHLGLGQDDIDELRRAGAVA
jgi:crotonobetainyl-CoA:carnitine CoA-transferase CaiB-like acyl-CoA transferase